MARGALIDDMDSADAAIIGVCGDHTDDDDEGADVDRRRCCRHRGHGRRGWWQAQTIEGGVWTARQR
jgi:hypothetical protein